jgi:hypothetical protein
MRYWLVIALFLLLPSLATAICQPDEGMTKDEVFAECGPPDYAEIIRSDNPDTAIPLSTNDAALLNNEHPVVLWQYDLFDGENSRIIMFRSGQVVRCCLPEPE